MCNGDMHAHARIRTQTSTRSDIRKGAASSLRTCSVNEHLLAPPDGISFCIGGFLQCSNFDTVVAVYASAPPTLAQLGEPVAVGDDCLPGHTFSCASLPVQTGSIYVVQVAGYNGALGNVWVRAGEPDS